MRRACAARPGPGPTARCRASARRRLRDAQLNIVWGNNATVANLHLVRQIRTAKRKGGKLVVIDPLRTKIAEQADLHLAVRPGTDVVLGFALAAELERLGAHDQAFIAQHVLGYDEFMALAREWPVGRAARRLRRAGRRYPHSSRGWMAEADPLVIAPGNGLERGRNGGSGMRAAIALPALMGKLGSAQRHRARRRQCVSEDAGDSCSGPIWSRPARAR